MPQPPIPSSVLVADLCVRTPHRMLRTRTYWTSDTAPENETQLTVIADAIKTAFTNALPNVLPDTNYFSRVECKWYGAGNAFFFANSVAAEGPGLIDVPDGPSEDGGSESEDVMPDSTGVIIQKKTGKRGPSKQGRIFIGGIAEKTQYGGQIAEGYESYFKTLAGKFSADITINAGGVNTVLHARHWDRKNNVMEPITKTYVVKGTTDLKRRKTKVYAERL